MVELHSHPTRHRTAELVIAAVGSIVVIAAVVGVGLLMQHNLKVGMAVAAMVSSVGCFAIAAFIVMGWIGLSIRGRFAGRTLDRVGIICFTVAGVFLAAVSVLGLLK